MTPAITNRTLFTLTRMISLTIMMGTALFASSPESLGLSQLKPPYVIAHRGGLLVWPEHTLEAYRASTEAGNHFVEVDCYLLRGGAMGIMHDYTLERTTNERGNTDQFDAKRWSTLLVDARRLLGPPWGTCRAPFVDEAIQAYGGRRILVLEAKNAGSGAAIVEKLKQAHVAKDFVLVNAFNPQELRAARSAGYPTCLNLNDETNEPAKLVGKKYWAVACPDTVSQSYVRKLKEAGLRVLVYTPRTHTVRDRLLSWGVDGFYSDDPVYMSLDDKFLRKTDPFAQQTWYPGMIEAQPGGRGRFTAPDKWGLDTSAENIYRGCLQGWLSPRKGGVVAPEWTVELSVTFGVGLMDGRWASLSVLTTDDPLDSDIPRSEHFGYNFLFHNNGGVSIYKYSGEQNMSPKLLGTTPGRAVVVGATRRYRIKVTPTQLTSECLDNGAKIIAEDSSNRGAYITLGTKGQLADFSNIKLRVGL